MFERYGEAARRAMFGALAEAQAQGSASIETEHLLLAAVAADPQVLERLVATGVNAESLRNQIVMLSWDREPVAPKRDVPLSNECKRVLAYSAEEAARLGDRIIVPGHLLLGIMREEGCLAANLLKEKGASLVEMRSRMAAEPREAGNLPPASPRWRAHSWSQSEVGSQAEDALAADLGRFQRADWPPRPDAGGFERYNEKARRVIFFARFEASNWGHGVIEPEHLLLGILREGLWIVYSLLGQQTPWNDVFPMLRARLGAADPKLATSVDMLLSDGSKRVLERAAAECDALGGGHVAVAHLLLALLDPDAGYPATLLRERGADAEEVRRKIASFRQ